MGKNFKKCTLVAICQGDMASNGVFISPYLSVNIGKEFGAQNIYKEFGAQKMFAV